MRRKTEVESGFSHGRLLQQSGAVAGDLIGEVGLRPVGPSDQVLPRRELLWPAGTCKERVLGQSPVSAPPSSSCPVTSTPHCPFGQFPASAMRRWGPHSSASGTTATAGNKIGRLRWLDKEIIKQRGTYYTTHSPCDEDRQRQTLGGRSRGGTYLYSKCVTLGAHLLCVWAYT